MRPSGLAHVLLPRNRRALPDGWKQRRDVHPHGRAELGAQIRSVPIGLLLRPVIRVTGPPLPDGPVTAPTDRRNRRHVVTTSTSAAKAFG